MVPGTNALSTSASATRRGNNVRMASKRERRVEYQARAARVAYLLAGTVRGAAEVLDRVHRAQPKLTSIPPDHLDRLVVLHAREWAADGRRRGTRRVREDRPTPGEATDASDTAALAHEVHAIALSMDRQHAEAWLFRHVEDFDDAQISRAMDSSKTATRRHLEAAEVTMHARLGERLLPATAALREYLGTLQAEPFMAAHRAIRRERTKRRAMVVGVVAGVILVAAIVVRVALL